MDNIVINTISSNITDIFIKLILPPPQIASIVGGKFFSSDPINHYIP